MDVRHLRHFAAVAETLHFGRAAEQLGMTQPPLSQSILALERELGAALFIRTKRHVALTAFGSNWLTEVLPLLKGLEALPEKAAQLREGKAGDLALLFVSTADYHVLPSLVRQFASQFPDVELKLREATSNIQLPALIDRSAHAGILIRPAQGFPAELNYHCLIQEPLIAAVPNQWFNGRRVVQANGRLRASTILNTPIILFPKEVAPAFHDLVTRYFTARGGQAQIVQEAIQMQTIISLVSAGLGIALVPASLRKLAREGVCYIDLEDAPTLETGLAWRRDDNTPTLEHFVEMVRGMAEWTTGDRTE